MADRDRTGPGAITWTDLTVDDAPAVRDFYRAVVGWEAEAVSMGDYDDFNMMAPGGGGPVAGICHARGGNAGLPAQWLLYITVDNLDDSLERCRERGGEVVADPRGGGEHGRYAVIRDPAGAVAALFEAAPERQ